MGTPKSHRVWYLRVRMRTDDPIVRERAKFILEHRLHQGVHNLHGIRSLKVKVLPQSKKKLSYNLKAVGRTASFIDSQMRKKKK